MENFKKKNHVNTKKNDTLLEEKSQNIKKKSHNSHMTKAYVIQ